MSTTSTTTPSTTRTPSITRASSTWIVFEVGEGAIVIILLAVAGIYCLRNKRPRNMHAMMHVDNDEPIKAEIATPIPEEVVCVVCQDAHPTHIISPCMHKCVFQDCGEQLQRAQPICPVCRGDIVSVDRVYE